MDSIITRHSLQLQKCAQQFARMDNVATTFAMGVDDQFHARLHTRARTRDMPVLSTQFAPRSVAQSENVGALCECHIAVDRTKWPL